MAVGTHHGYVTVWDVAANKQVIVDIIYETSQLLAQVDAHQTTDSSQTVMQITSHIRQLLVSSYLLIALAQCTQQYKIK